MSIAIAIRQFCTELFRSNFVSLLQEDLLRTRADYEARLQEYRQQVNDLKHEKMVLENKITTLEISVFPTVSKVGADIVRRANGSPKPEFGGGSFDMPEKSAWQAAQAEWEKQQEAEEKEMKKSATAPGA